MNQVNYFEAPTTDEPMEQEEVHDLPLAGRGRRLGAVLLDSLFFLIAGLPMFIGIFTGNQSEPNVPLLIVGLLLMLALTVYNIVLMFTQQQTLGKRVLGLRVVRSNGERCSGSRYFWLRSVLVGMIGNIPLVGPLFAIVDPLMIFRESRQCLHDNIADTNVVQLPQSGEAELA